MRLKFSLMILIALCSCHGSLGRKKKHRDKAIRESSKHYYTDTQEDWSKNRESKNTGPKNSGLNGGPQNDFQHVGVKNGPTKIDTETYRLKLPFTPLVKSLASMSGIISEKQLRSQPEPSNLIFDVKVPSLRTLLTILTSSVSRRALQHPQAFVEIAPGAFKYERITYPPMFHEMNLYKLMRIKEQRTS